MLYTGDCDTSKIQVVIHKIQAVVIHVIYRRL